MTQQHVRRARSAASGRTERDAEEPAGAGPDVHAPGGVGVGDLQALMRSGGNLGMVQLTEGDERPQADDGLDGALAELDRALARRPDPGSFEAITGSTGTEGAYVGDIVRAVPHRWQHQTLGYAGAAREQADADTTTTSEANDGLDVLTAEEGPGNPTASASLPGRSAPTRRWGLMVTCADYEGSRGDIPDFQSVAAANRSGAESRAGGFDDAQPLVDPTRASFLRALDGRIAALHGSLSEGQTGELTVAIAAHGGAGYVIMQDIQHVTYAELEARAATARAQGVRIVFVIDACLSGELVQRANEAATTDLLMEAAGGSAQQREARQLLDVVGQLNAPLGVVNTQGGHVRLRGRTFARTRTRPHYDSMLEALRWMQDGLDDVAATLRGATLPASEAASLPAVLEAVTEANTASLLALGGDMSGVRQTVRMAGAAVDAVNGLVSRLLERARTVMRGGAS